MYYKMINNIVMDDDYIVHLSIITKENKFIFIIYTIDKIYEGTTKTTLF